MQTKEEAEILQVKYQCLTGYYYGEVVTGWIASESSRIVIAVSFVLKQEVSRTSLGLK